MKEYFRLKAYFMPEMSLWKYAFQNVLAHRNLIGEGVRVFNPNNKKSAAVFQKDGTFIETNMDDIELVIAKDYFISSLKYMEE